jgi:hypothetical protein
MLGCSGRKKGQTLSVRRSSSQKCLPSGVPFQVRFGAESLIELGKQPIQQGQRGDRNITV